MKLAIYADLTKHIRLFYRNKNSRDSWFVSELVISKIRYVPTRKAVSVIPAFEGVEFISSAVESEAPSSEYQSYFPFRSILGVVCAIGSIPAVVKRLSYGKDNAGYIVSEFCSNSSVEVIRVVGLGPIWLRRMDR